MKYKTTKAQCKKMIMGVCSYCGGQLVPIKIVDNSGHPTYWGGCQSCSIFQWGTDPHVYKIAHELTREHSFRGFCYSHIRYDSNDSEETREYKQQHQVSGACALVAKVLRLNKREGK